MVFAVEHDHVHIGAAQRLGGFEAAETAAGDHDGGTLAHGRSSCPPMDR